MRCTPTIHELIVLTLPPRHRCPLDRLPASRLLLPRSGLERSDSVRWHETDLPTLLSDVRCWVNSGNHLLAASISPFDPEQDGAGKSIDQFRGNDAAKISAGIAVAVAKIGERGWQGDTCMITPDEAGRAMLEKTLRGAAYGCVVIGGGLRIPPKSLALFEMVVNAVHKAAPSATIAFNTRPEDTAEAAARQLNPG